MSRKLYETFGEAAHDMVEWMQQVNTSRSELRELYEIQFARLSSLISDKINEFRVEISSEFSRLERRIDGLEVKLEQRSADLIKWSFVFWVGAVGAIALLAGVLK